MYYFYSAFNLDAGGFSYAVSGFDHASIVT